MKKRSCFSLYLLLASLGCATIQTQCAQKPEPKELWVTVFVHGTLMPHWTLTDIMKMLNGNVHNTTYGRYLRQFRSTPFFFKSQAIQGLGLQPVSEPSKEPANSAATLAHIFNRFQEKYDESTKDHCYYTYGWSGLLNEDARLKTADLFYKDLKKEMKRLQSQTDKSVKLRLIGYSHGGNLIMNIPVVAEMDKKPLQIDEAVLLGTPIQSNTYSGVDPRFIKKIYNLYSTGDRVQNKDCISGTNAQRTFAWNKLDHPEIVTQVRVRLNRRHTPSLSEIDRRLRPEKVVNPGHIELWFFGWGSNHYRERLPISPYPLIAMVPYITRMIEEFKNSPSMLVEIAPNAHESVVRTYDKEDNQTDLHVRPFLSAKESRRLKAEVKKFKPHDYRKQYKKRLERVLRKIRKRTIS